MRNIIHADRNAIVRLPDGSLVQCTTEPIHSPGATQVFGILFVLTPDDLQISMISELNVEAWLGKAPEAILGTSFLDLLHDHEPFTEALLSLRSRLSGEGLAAIKKLCIKARLARAYSSKELSARTPVIYLNVSLSAEAVLVDLELEKDSFYPRDSTKNGKQVSLPVLTHQISTLPRTTLQEFLDGLTLLLRQETGYERAITYMFDPDGHALILSEAVNEALTEVKYKGFIFPRSGMSVSDCLEQNLLIFLQDIPIQARNMYKQTHFQSVYDVDAPVSQLVTRSGDEEKARHLNLMNSGLRAVSRTHLEYLRIMQVRASMSIAITISGELWGMVSFHNSSPKRLTPLESESFIALSALLASTIESVTWKEEALAQHALADRVLQDTPVQSLLVREPQGFNRSGGTYFFSSRSVMDESHKAVQILLKDLSFTRTYFKADGAVIHIDDMATLYDLDKDFEEEAIRICHFLRFFKSKDLIISRTCRRDFAQNLSNYCPEAPVFDKFAGLLLFPISEDGSSFFAYFRLGHTETLRWGGNPNQPFYFDKAAGALMPRESFNTYHEKFEGLTEPWSAQQVSLAKVLRRIYTKFHEMWDESTRSTNLDKLKSMMIANVSHEIRTPLHAIINFNELAMESELLSEAKGYIRNAFEAGRRLMSTINDLLDLTRLDYGQTIVKHDPFHLKTVIASATRLLSIEAEKKGLETVFECSDEFDSIPAVVGDEGKLWQAITNLFANAIKYTEKGFVKIECTLLDLKSDSVTLNVSICDSGRGIPREKLETIFDAFVRAHETTSVSKVRPVEGTGLGLAIVARLIRMQNGTLQVKSDEGQGSCFSFSLPYQFSDQKVSRDENEVETSIINVAPSSNHQLCILAAEDNVLNRKILQKRLSKDGHTLTLCEDGQECYEIYKKSLEDSRKKEFDLIIMDVQMPRMDGYEATNAIRKVKQELGKKRIPILSVSAHSYKEDLIKCRDSGMDGYATKPLLFGKLKRMLDQVWEHRINGRPFTPTDWNDVVGWFDTPS